MKYVDILRHMCYTKTVKEFQLLRLLFHKLFLVFLAKVPGCFPAYKAKDHFSGPKGKRREGMHPPAGGISK